MKRAIRILGLGFGVILLAIFIYERYFLTKWYDFKMGNLEIEVMSDECETCFLDWPIDHTIWIDSKTGTNGKFELYTEGPHLEFGFNDDQSELIINCPGFSNIFIDLEKMQEIDVPYLERDMKLNEYKIQRIVNKNKKLVLLDSLRLPDKNWALK